MNIRFAEKKDAKQIIELCKLHAAFEKAAYNSKNKEEKLSKYLFDDLNSIECLVIEKEHQLVGYATFMKQFSTWDTAFYIYLDCLFLKEETRGLGFGTRLMNEVKTFAKKEKCNIIQWQTPDLNKKAIDFYQKLGATSKSKERFTWVI